MRKVLLPLVKFNYLGNDESVRKLQMAYDRIFSLALANLTSPSDQCLVEHNKTILDSPKQTRP
jgi:hypothetical protein